MVFSPRLFSALVSAGFSRVTLLLDVPDRWIIHNPECMELLLGLNPPLDDPGHVSRVRSQQDAS